MMFLAYKSGVDRMHFLIPGHPSLWRVGVAVSSTDPPTAVDGGTGTYAATKRWYRYRWSNSVTISEPTPSVEFTPSGTGAHVAVTIPPIPPGENITYWALEASANGTDFYIITSDAVTTPTWIDTMDPADYSDNWLSPVLGTMTLPPSARYITSDGNRLIMANGWENGFNSRIWWTPVLGTGSSTPWVTGDEQRLFQTATIKPYMDLNEGDGGEITGLSRPSADGAFFAFKRNQIWRVIPTGNLNAPYQAKKISSTVGALTQKSVANAEDSVGNPAIYFMSSRGPYRIGPTGVEYIGRDIEDQTRDIAIGDAGTRDYAGAHSVYYKGAGQVWFWSRTFKDDNDPSGFPAMAMVFDIRRGAVRDQHGVRGGWSIYTGIKARCSTLYPNVGDNFDERPHTGYGEAGAPIMSVCDLWWFTGESYKAYLRTRSLIPSSIPLGTMAMLREPLLIAQVESTRNLDLWIVQDLGAQRTPAHVSIPVTTPAAPSIIKFGDSWQSDMGALQIEVGDLNGSTGAEWIIFAIVARVTTEGEV